MPENLHFCWGALRICGQMNYICRLWRTDMHYGDDMVDADLYYSIHAADCSVEGFKTSGSWIVFVRLHDTYDFDLKSFNTLGNIANDFGYILQKINNTISML